ncbi:lipopolysaccharide transport system ATP-binding protein [Bradyrhizobium shewense]|uniref:Lipopolysaccharide transport system ATP-binding protein n=1 Tax=Bradyrhizobium shewense TaxID=1761772 RepID=A0A1C3WR94_9BRAD|nr:ABC transporter ATP-binding protein [Bradyrhizobium shewense]SCB42582.1 lipopolysaccharide transport system ATP-binding protein [Bradyrhizobium shewense]
MTTPVIEVDALSKQYAIGTGGSATLGRVARELAWLPYRKLRGHPIPPIIKKRQTFWPLRDISFSVGQGEVVGIIGSNGAGKSTLLKILSRIISPTLGSATIRGRVSSLIEVGTGFNANMTGRENIFLNASLHGLTRSQITTRLDEIVEFSGVEKFIDTPVKHYSSGMYSRLAFSVAAHLDPDLLFVDEVLAVGDIAFQQKCLNRFSEMVGGSRTVLFVSHNLSAVSNICSKVLWLDQGQVRYFGSTEAGIAEYYKAMIPATVQSLDTRHERIGTGDLRFSSISFYDGNMQRCERLKSGQDVIIGLRYQARPEKLEPIRDLSISVVFKNDKGQRLFGTPSEVLPTTLPTRIHSEGEYLIRIPQLPLLPGIYDLDLGCIINRSTTDKLISAKRLIVTESDFFGTGRLPPNQQGDILVKFSNEWR